ncbi:hypothetical protein TEA_021318 [Camellia sinensis var. sinensis]|uniref:Uncharacterized protein n=1 Tax=Camellia sinensis var. sinensis TaxID=542762 RepID=A0A4S4F382_CAMSN|nr:hypothetical protein TEA_021318 [Camellia sinensis var. sinensis]
MWKALTCEPVALELFPLCLDGTSSSSLSLLLGQSIPCTCLQAFKQHTKPIAYTYEADIRSCKVDPASFHFSLSRGHATYARLSWLATYLKGTSIQAMHHHYMPCSLTLGHSAVILSLSAKIVLDCVLSHLRWSPAIPVWIAPGCFVGLWDINMDSGPVSTFQVHEYLRPKLCDLYENDSIFDKFECCLSGDGLRVATGSYSNLFRVFGRAAGSNEATTLEASKNPMRRQVQTPSRPSRSLGSITRVVRRGSESPGVDANGNSYDFTTKLLHLAWHPTENSIACAAANSLYMYYA